MMESVTPPKADKAVRPRVFVIEDEVMIAMMIETLLTEMGFTDIVLAANGPQARAAADRSPPGLVISDVNLGPGVDGISTAAALHGALGMPVIFVTAYADEETRARIGREVPGAPVLRKPFVGNALREAILEALAA